jgi:ribosomal protein L37AE/L43A
MDMSERVLRGSRLGSVSYETERDNADSAPRQDVVYVCPKGHRTVLPFSMEAELPDFWQCKVCGSAATRVGAEEPTRKAGKAPRTHWDMLLERRTVDDLEEVLAERLAVLRGQEPHRKAS